MHLNKFSSIWSSGSREKIKDVKIYRQTDGRRPTCDQKSLLELSFRLAKKQFVEYHAIDLFFSVSNRVKIF